MTTQARPKEVQLRRCARPKCVMSPTCSLELLAHFCVSTKTELFFCSERPIDHSEKIKSSVFVEHDLHRLPVMNPQVRSKHTGQTPGLCTQVPLSLIKSQSPLIVLSPLLSQWRHRSLAVPLEEHDKEVDTHISLVFCCALIFHWGMSKRVANGWQI